MVKQIKKRNGWKVAGAIVGCVAIVGGAFGLGIYAGDDSSKLEAKDMKIENLTTSLAEQPSVVYVENTTKLDALNSSLTTAVSDKEAIMEDLEALKIEPEFRELEMKASLRESALAELDSKEVLKAVADVLDTEYGVVAKWDDISLKVDMDDSEEIDESFSYKLGGIDFVDPEYNADEEDARVTIIAEAKGRDVDDERFKDLMVKLTFEKEELDFDFVKAKKA